MTTINNNWIDPKEQLPQQGLDVLILLKEATGDLIDVAWLDDGKNNDGHCFVGTDYGFDLEDVNGWQPIQEGGVTIESTHKTGNYNINDLNEFIIVTVPCATRSGKSSYKIVVTCPIAMSLLRQFAKQKVEVFYNQNENESVTIEEVSQGYFHEEYWQDLIKG